MALETESALSSDITTKPTKKAVVLLSGGIDSTVTAYIAKKEVGKRGELFALSFEYGQRHKRELESASVIAELLDAAHLFIKLPTIPIVSALLESSSLRPRETGVEEGVPDTWVPQRNSVFLTYAFAIAESIGADKVYIGVNCIDYSGYPDCRPNYIEAMNRALNLGSKQFAETGRRKGIITPLLRMTKHQIIEKGLFLGVPFDLTWSCYNGSKYACGVCDSCRIRLEGFRKLGVHDPIEYE